MYIGSESANTANAIEMIPISKTSTDVKADTRLIFDNNPIIPKNIMMNPTR